MKYRVAPSLTEVNQLNTSASTTKTAVIPAPSRFGIAALTYVVNEAIREFDGAGPDSISDDEVHKFLARVLDEMGKSQ